MFVRFSKTKINKIPFGGNNPTINRNPYHRLLYDVRRYFSSDCVSMRALPPSVRNNPDGTLIHYQKQPTAHPEKNAFARMVPTMRSFILNLFYAINRQLHACFLYMTILRAGWPRDWIPKNNKESLPSPKLQAYSTGTGGHFPAIKFMGSNLLPTSI